MGKYSVLTDAPIRTSGDLLSFGRYVNPLVEMLTSPETQTPFTVGIFGTWGSGKSSLLSLVDEHLAKHHHAEFLCLWFNPWNYRKEPNLLVPLLHTLHDVLAKDPLNRFLEAAENVAKVLVVLGADVVLNTITAGSLSIDKLQKTREALKNEQFAYQSEIRNLRKTLEDVTEGIYKSGARLVLFIDDLDRCEPDAIIDLLESVKLFFNVPHTFIFLAVDKEMIDRGIEVKYSKFPFADERRSALGAEYLEKMVQLPLTLYPLYQTQVRKFIVDLKPPPEVEALSDLLSRFLKPNPRKIKRVLNILITTNAIQAQTPELAQLIPDLIARLAVLQVQFTDFYSRVVVHPEVLIFLETLYRNQFSHLKVDPLDTANSFGDLKDYLVQTAEKHYSPEGDLAEIFRDSKFIDHENLLPEYLSMLGG